MNGSVSLSCIPVVHVVLAEFAHLTNLDFADSETEREGGQVSEAGFPAREDT